MKWKIPTPFGLAVALSVLVFALCWIFTLPTDSSFLAYGGELAEVWYNGFWGLLSFTMQMVMILVLGHMLALSPLVTRGIDKFISQFSSGHTATASTAFLTLIMAWCNWGLGLIFGAIMARKLGEYAAKRNLHINYPLVGAAGYCGLMFWHGGLSGSATLSIAEPNHKFVELAGVVSTSNTIFTLHNAIVSIVILTIVPAVVYWWSKKSTKVLPTLLFESKEAISIDQSSKKMKKEVWVQVFGLLMLSVAIGVFIQQGLKTGDIFKAVNLNFINFTMFGLALLALGSQQRFEQALAEATNGAAGILVQFPLYAGIMALMDDSGMLLHLANGFVAISNEKTFPLFTFLSAGMVNVLVPSGGGQWAVQGGVIIEAAQSLKIPLEKGVMALCYGDQLTNLIQPFWALPLLAITKLKAREILPYTAKLLLVGLAVYGVALLLW